MQGKKNNPKLQILFAAMFLALVFVMELYAMINMQTQFLVIGALAIVFLACIYMLIRAILLLQAEKEARREEHYENIFKSEKASFLMAKKHFEDIDAKLSEIEESASLPVDEIVGTQKGVGKIIINRNRENAEAIINSNEVILDSFGGLRDSLDSSNEKIIESYKSIMEEQMSQMMLKQQELISDMKDMEIRLNNAIAQIQIVAPASVQTEVSPASSKPEMPENHEENLIDAKEASVIEVEAEKSQPIAPEPQPSQPEVIVQEPEAASVSEAPAQPEEAVQEPEISASPSPAVDMSDPNKKMGADDIAALFASMSQEPEESAANEAASQPEEVVQEPEAASVREAPAQPEEVVQESEISASPSPAVDMSDPNKKLGADDIEALFAAMSQEATETASEPEKEETPPAPQVDLTDPNKKMSADEIAALFSSMGA